jgi:putative aldouronate transport system substrate-binding protein
MKKQRIIPVFIACLLTAALLVSCSGKDKAGGQAGGEAAAEAKKKVRWLFPGGSEGKNHEAITKYVNELLDKDNMNIEFSAIPIAWDVWEQKINLMFSTGDEFEFVHVPEGFGPGYVEMWNNGASIKLNELLDQHGQALKRTIPDWLWEAAAIDGNITTIPAYWVETANLKGGISFRKDLYDKYNLPLPKGLTELITISKQLQQTMIRNEGYSGTPYVYMRYQEIQTFPHRTYDTYPFTVIEQFLLIRQDGKVESWIDSPEFKKDCEFFNALYSAGLVNPDILSQSLEDLWANFNMGNYLFSEYNTTNTTDLSMQQNSNNDTIHNEYLLFNPEKKILRDQGVRNSNIVSSTSPNPDAAVRFHNWMYANNDAYLAVQFGIEGLTYKKYDTGEIETIPNEPNLGLADWMIANINLQPRYRGINPQWVDTAGKEEKNAVNSVIIGFAFDPSPVSTQYANCLSEVKNVIYPLRSGVLSYNTGYKAASDAFKAAGINDVVAEYQKQLAAWLSSR